MNRINTIMPPINFGTIIRRPKSAQFIVNDFMAIILCLAGLVVAGMQECFLESILFWASLIISLCLIYRLIYLKQTIYYITPEQLIYEHGVFHRSRDFIELYRVIDFREESSFLQQLFGIKTIKVYSGDRTTPCLKMAGMERKDLLIPPIRDRVVINRKMNGIYEITNR